MTKEDEKNIKESDIHDNNILGNFMFLNKNYKSKCLKMTVADHKPVHERLCLPPPEP